MKIIATVKMSRVDQWYVDWDNEKEKTDALKQLKHDIKIAISDGCGVDLDNTEVNLKIQNNE
jgi:hypothetical protein